MEAEDEVKFLRSKKYHQSFQALIQARRRQLMP